MVTCRSPPTPPEAKESRGLMRRTSGLSPWRRQASAERGVSTILLGGGFRSPVTAPLTLSLSGSSLVKITVFMVCGNTVSSMVVDLVKLGSQLET